MPDADPSLEAAAIRIGEWDVEPRRNLLSCADRTVRLEPKVVELLVHLARRKGEVVGREELLQAVWPGVVVGDDTLTQAVNKLRRSLGDDAHAPTYIETISKRGYRLIAPVGMAPGSVPAVTHAASPMPHRRWRWWAGIALAGAAVAAALMMLGKARWPFATDDYPGAGDFPPIVAVLPLANQSGDASRDYFSDGVTEDVIGALGRFTALRVISRSSVEQYKGNVEGARGIRDALGARYIVNGSIRETDGQLRVAVELSDADRGIVLWSERFQGAGQDVFFIQDQIVKNIVGHLAVKVTQLERERARLKPVASLEAYDLVLRARPLRQTNRASNRRARDMLARALQLAPNYADAHVQLASAELAQIENGWVEHPVDKLAVLEKRLLRALAIDDPGANARAHGMLGFVHSFRGEYDQALIEMDRALEINPSDAFALRARGATLLFLGRIDDAIATLELERRFNPASDTVIGALRALAYYTARRYPEALAAANLALMRYPHSASAHVMRAATLAQMGEPDAAREAAARAIEFDPALQVRNFGTQFRDPQHAAHLQEGLRKAGF